jgi:hypothetical protein
MSSKKQATIKNYILHDDTVFKKESNPLVDYWAKVDGLSEAKPLLNWKGKPLPTNLLKQAIAFCRWSSKKFDGEGLLWLFYDQGNEENPWTLWAPPQITNGMTVKSDPDNPKFAEQRKHIKGIHFGTIHDHHSMGAGQSGVDEEDEAELEGIHITFGNTDKKILSFHVRINVGQHLSHTFHPTQWFELPDWFINIPQNLKKDSNLLKGALDSEFLSYNPKDPEKGFPDQWKHNIVKEKKTYATGLYTGQDFFLKNEETPFITSQDITPRERSYLNKLEAFMYSILQLPAGTVELLESLIQDIETFPVISNIELIEMGYTKKECKIADKIRKFIDENTLPYPSTYSMFDYFQYLMERTDLPSPCSKRN